MIARQIIRQIAPAKVSTTSVGEVTDTMLMHKRWGKQASALAAKRPSRGVQWQSWINPNKGPGPIDASRLCGCMAIIGL